MTENLIQLDKIPARWEGEVVAFFYVLEEN